MKRQSPDPTAGRFVERRPGLLISQARNPLLQNCLAARLNCDEGDSHPRVRLGVNHLAECGEACAAMRNSQRNFRVLWEWTCGVHMAAEKAQVGGTCAKKTFCPHVGQLNASCE